MCKTAVHQRSPYNLAEPKQSRQEELGSGFAKLIETASPIAAKGALPSIDPGELVLMQTKHFLLFSLINLCVIKKTKNVYTS